jgi:hypothetical protein
VRGSGGVEEDEGAACSLVHSLSFLKPFPISLYL